ncbi:MAG: hypothetical protein ACRD3A_11505, partial [Terriglobales bacterium]
FTDPLGLECADGSTGVCQDVVNDPNYNPQYTFRTVVRADSNGGYGNGLGRGQGGRVPWLTEYEARGGDILGSVGQFLMAGSLRKPGETLLDCTLRNANEATFGQHSKLVAAVAATAAAAAASATQLSNPAYPLAGPPTMSLAQHIGTFAAFSAYLVSGGTLPAAAVDAVGNTVAGGIYVVGRAAPVAAAAEAGLLIGSAFNCR